MFGAFKPFAVNEFGSKIVLICWMEPLISTPLKAKVVGLEPVWLFFVLFYGGIGLLRKNWGIDFGIFCMSCVGTRHKLTTPEKGRFMSWH